VAAVAAREYPAAGGQLGQFEMDCRDWRMAFGVAYGIARGEDPYESQVSVCRRALDAARDAFTRWAGDDIFTVEEPAREPCAASR
jgi:hypothetical protein